MKAALLSLCIVFSVPAFSSCGDMDGVMPIVFSSTSPWFLTTFALTGKDIINNCKEVRALRSDAQRALVDGVVSEKLEKALLNMQNDSSTAQLNIEAKLERIISELTELN